MNDGDRTQRDGVSVAPDDAVAPFGPGIRVALRQYAPEGQDRGLRELGVGEILTRPRLGERLEIRIRGERGLASSPVRELCLLGGSRLAVVTGRCVYVLSLLEGESSAPEPPGFQERIAAMLDEPAAPETDPGAMTQYVRIGEPLLRPGRAPLLGCSVRIERRPVADPEAKPEALGSGRLLAEPELGLSLRFQDGDGQVVTTSPLEAVELDGPGVVEARTRNSRYRFEVEPDEPA